MVAETYKLVKTIKKMYPVVEFLHDRYFPDGKTFYSQKALIETKKKGRKVAPFVIPVVGGIAMEKDGYKAYDIEAPYIAPKMPITAKELELKAFGESPESNRTPAERENELEAEHMDDLRISILRRIELMCSDLLQTGKITMNHYASADDAANGTNARIQYLQFYETEFKNNYLFTSDFTTMTAAQRIQEFYKMATVLRKRGIRSTDIVMTADVSMLLMTDLDFLEFYNKANVATGKIDQSDLPEGVVRNGVINVNGVIMTMFTYDEEYEDLDGETKEVFPRGTIALLRPKMGETVYAQVTFIDGKGFKSYAEPIVPRLVADEKNNLMEVQAFSRPVPYPYDWDSWLIANIYADVVDEETADNAVDTDEEGTADSATLLTVAEIEAMTKKADVIAYAESIGLSGLSTSQTLAELIEATINYQLEKYS